MRIAFIGQKGIPARSGGVEKHVEDLSRRLVGLGHEVYVYTRPNYTDVQLKTWEGVNLISLPSVGTKHLDAITHTFRACLDVARRQVDVVHFHSIGPSSLIWLVKLLKPNTPVVATFHTQCYQHQKWGWFAKTYLKFGEWAACKLADRTIAVSKTLSKYASQKYHKNIEYVPNGVEQKQVSGANELAQWGLEPNNYVVSVSRLIKHKGLHYLVKAWSGLKTDKKLVIVGDGSFTDSYVADLKKLSAKDSRVVLTGNQTGEALAQLFGNAYMFVQPSESEGLSIALLEAMAYGRAVLVSDIPENLEPVGENALAFANKSIRSLRERLAELLVDSARVEQNGRENRQLVDTNYNWTKITADILRVYGSAMQARANKKPRAIQRKEKSI